MIEAAGVAILGISSESSTSVRKGNSDRAEIQHMDRRYFHDAHFIPIVGVGKRGVY